jgi:hypothetical protein
VETIVQVQDELGRFMIKAINMTVVTMKRAWVRHITTEEFMESIVNVELYAICAKLPRIERNPFSKP